MWRHSPAALMGLSWGRLSYHTRGIIMLSIDSPITRIPSEDLRPHAKVSLDNKHYCKPDSGKCYCCECLDELNRRKRQKHIETELAPIEHFSTGPAAGCSDCNMPEEPTEDDYQMYSEGSFSWSSCDLCHDTNGGTKYAAHGFDKTTGALIHYDICETCLLEQNT